ncbi:MAG: outer membrane protein transport protein [Chthoniobacterales bacterium]
MVTVHSTANGRAWLAILAAGGLLLNISAANAAGLFLDGADARSMALGGEEAAQTGSAIAAMDSNPAALSGTLRPELEISAGGAFLRGEFARDDGELAHLRSNAALIPAAGLAIPGPRNFPITFGIGVIPEMMLDANWRYRDALGGLGGTTTYGEQKNRSRILALRTSFGAAIEPAHWLSLGASVGFTYNQNALFAPYIFQSQPVLAGFKTLLDLNTDGVAPCYDFGVQIRPTSKITLGASYRPRVVIHTDGTASGNASAQLKALGPPFSMVNPNFTYNAEVRTELPQIASVGGEWQALNRLRFVAGVDWINWADAFDELNIHLSNGSNAAINGVVGSDSMTDIAPLRWRDQWVYRTGAEYVIGGGFTARAGYTYARSAVPPQTMTPLTAAIFDHKVSAGVGYKKGRYHADLVWQWSLPAKQHVGRSILLDGEYSDASVLVTAHLFELTTGVEF